MTLWLQAAERLTTAVPPPAGPPQPDLRTVTYPILVAAVSYALMLTYFLSSFYTFSEGAPARPRDHERGIPRLRVPLLVARRRARPVALETLASRQARLSGDRHPGNDLLRARAGERPELDRPRDPHPRLTPTPEAGRFGSSASCTPSRQWGPFSSSSCTQKSGPPPATTGRWTTRSANLEREAELQREPRDNPIRVSACRSSW